MEIALETPRGLARRHLQQPRYFHLPIRPYSLCSCDSQSVMLSLLVRMHRSTGSWQALSLQEIHAYAAAEVDRDWSKNHPFRSLPTRVIQKGLDGLCANGLLVEIEAEAYIDMRFQPTVQFFALIRPFHLLHRYRWIPERVRRIV